MSGSTGSTGRWSAVTSCAYVDSPATIPSLRELIEDPRVATVRVADIAFDLERPR
ncbi:hypothetical protein [Streptosporangium sp. NPDC003464]